MSRPEPKNIDIKHAAENLNDWQLVFEVNPYTKKKQVTPKYKGNDLTWIQFGTPDDMVYCQQGLTYYSQGSGFTKITNSKDTRWTNSVAPNDKGYVNGKANCELTVHNWEEAGKQGFYMFQFISGIIELVIQGLAHGIDDGNGGKIEIAKCALTDDPIQKENYFRSMLTTPLVPPKDGYAPKLKTKVRWSLIGRDPNNKTIKLNIDVINGRHTPNSYGVIEPVKPWEQFNYVRERSRAIYMFQVNPLNMKQRDGNVTEINLTIDQKKVLFLPNESIGKNVAFIGLDSAMSEAKQEEEAPTPMEVTA